MFVNIVVRMIYYFILQIQHQQKEGVDVINVIKITYITRVKSIRKLELRKLNQFLLRPVRSNIIIAR